MPLIDLPLNELKKYKGTNPCPANIDEFWDKSIAEMKSIDPKVELKESDFKVNGLEFYHLYFTGTLGARVHAKLVRPAKQTKPMPAILTFHGYSGSSGDWTGMLAYATMGFTIASLDCRGQAGLSQDVGGVTGNTFNGHIIRGLKDALNGKIEKLLFRNIFLDTAQLAKIIIEMPNVDPKRVGAIGWSQGGGLAVACASLEPRIKKVIPVYPFLADYKRVWNMDLAKSAYNELTEYFRTQDPMHKNENKIFEMLGYIDTQNIAKRIKADVLWGIGLMDTICPPSTQFAVYNKIKSKKEMAIYPDYGHETPIGFSDTCFKFLMNL